MKTVKEYARQISETIKSEEEHRNYRVSILYQVLGEPIDKVTENDLIMLASDLLEKFGYEYDSDFDIFWKTVLIKLNEG